MERKEKHRKHQLLITSKTCLNDWVQNYVSESLNTGQYKMFTQTLPNMALGVLYYS